MGWLDEVRALLQMGYGPSDPGFKAHGYRAMAEVLSGRLELHEAIEQTSLEVRQYAKRQRTWLRKESSLIRLAPIGIRDLKISVANLVKVG